MDGFRKLSILLWVLLELSVNRFTQAKFKVRNPCGIRTLEVGSQSFKCETRSRCVWSVWVGLGVISDLCRCVF